MEDDDDLPEAEVVDLGEADDEDVIDTPDGGAIVRLDDDEMEPRSDDFLANLAEEMPESELQTLAQTYLDLIGKDKEARKKRDEQYEEGLRPHRSGRRRARRRAVQRRDQGRPPDADRGLRGLRRPRHQGAVPAAGAGQGS